jgi:hypothetical protein
METAHELLAEVCHECFNDLVLVPQCQTNEHAYEESTAFLRKNFLTVPTDKAKSQPFYFCKRFAYTQVLGNLTQAASFKQVPKPCVSTIRSELCSFISSITVPDPGRWAVMFPLFKPHKGNVRFITSCANIYITDAAKLLMRLLEIVTDDTKKFCSDLAKQLHDSFGLMVRLYNVVTDYMTAGVNVPDSVELPDMCTADISKCYDVMPIDINDPHSIPARLKFLLSMVYSEKMHWKFVVRRSRNDAWLVTLVEHAPNDSEHILMESIPMFAACVLRHCYIEGCGRYWQPVIGCPQGIPPGPILVNLHLLTYDIEFVLLSMLSKEGRQDINDMYCRMLKLLDDLAVFGIKRERALELFAKIYPKHIKIEDTTQDIDGPDGRQVFGKFVGIGIGIDPHGVVSLQTTDKTDVLPFEPIRYVKAATNRSRSASRNIIIGQLLPTVILNTRMRTAKAHLQKLIQIFLRNGFSAEEIKRTGDRYLGKVDFSFLCSYNVKRIWKDAWFKAVQHSRRMAKKPG